MGGRAKVAAEQMIGKISAMTVDQLIEFVAKKEEVTDFLKQLQKEKAEFSNLVRAQADLNQIEKLLAAAKSDRASVAAELDQARARAKEIETAAIIHEREAKQALSEAQQEARKIMKRATDEAAKMARTTELDRDAAEADREKAAQLLERAAAHERASSEARQALEIRRAKVESLIKEFG